MLSTQQARGMLRLVYDLTTSLTAAATTYATLIVALKSLTSSNFSVSSTGSIIATSANGRSVTLASPNSFAAGPTDFAETAAYFRDLYDDSRAGLIDTGVTSPTDAQIWTEMMDRLQPIRRATSEFTTLRD